MKIAVITDLHYSRTKNLACPERAGEKAQRLLACAVEVLNTRIKPDLLLVGGDLVNDPGDLELLRELAELFGKVECPRIILPGNHDPAPPVFYEIFPRPPAFLDLQGIRFLAFPEDLQTPGCNSIRKEEDLRLLAERSGELPTVLFQHVPFYKPDTLPCYYRYENADEILQACGNVVLSISGHEHKGFMPSFDSPFPVLVIPAMCEGQYPFAVVELDEKGKLSSCSLHFLAAFGA